MGRDDRDTRARLPSLRDGERKERTLIAIADLRRGHATDTNGLGTDRVK